MEILQEIIVSHEIKTFMKLVKFLCRRGFVPLKGDGKIGAPRNNADLVAALSATRSRV